MSVSVDTVYKTVLLILNKEQRGYMTPDEFNKIGSQVQRETFERYFEDINQNVRVQQTDFDYANRVYNTDEKIAEFKTENIQANPVDVKTITGVNPFTVPSELYRLNSVTYEGGVEPVEMQRLTRNEYYNISKSKLTKPSKNCPIYLYEDNKAIVYPNTIIDPANIKMQYVKKPKDIRWGYVMGNLGQYSFTNYDYIADGINIGDIEYAITNSFDSSTPQPNIGNFVNATYTTNGSGSGAEFTITTLGGGVVSSIQVTNPGSGYVVGEEITFDQAQFGSQTSGPLKITLTSASLMSSSQQGYVDFGLHNSERTEIVLNILLYSGIVIRDPQIVQTAMAQINKEEVNEKK
jgi:hypothetical protein